VTGKKPVAVTGCISNGNCESSGNVKWESQVFIEYMKEGDIPSDGCAIYSAGLQ
jgi:hypothetical protein